VKHEARKEKQSRARNGKAEIRRGEDDQVRGMILKFPEGGIPGTLLTTGERGRGAGKEEGRRLGSLFVKLARGLQGYKKQGRGRGKG